MDGNALKAWQSAHRWTNAALARELELGESTIYRYRNGERPIPRTFELALKTLAES